MPTIEDVIGAFEHYIEERKALQECLGECEYDASWFCRDSYKSVSDAAVLAKETLDAYIDERINEKLAQYRS